MNERVKGRVDLSDVLLFKWETRKRNNTIFWVSMSFNKNDAWF